MFNTQLHFNAGAKCSNVQGLVGLQIMAASENQQGWVQQCDCMAVDEDRQTGKPVWRPP